ncbi:glycerophosphodiester phosphodiesterase [Aquabacterium sp. A3]|uniref:glycerophosphodiester phosphodiesterase n=1 Tax=Aquabacterium sp. A3 TaxID=3132829 RepID=UPI0031196764
MSEWPYPCWIAHRGAGTLAPENTLAAFRLGADHGFAMFECDVKLSADGEPFLLHDDELDRTTNGQGAARVQSWDALSRLDAGSWHGRIYAGESLLRLEALSRWLQALGLMVNLELKPAMGEERRTGQVVAQRVAQWWRDSEVKPLLSSFSVEALEAARDAAPALPRALLLDRWQIDGVQQAVQLGCVAMVVHHSFLDARRIDAIHEMGLKALAYTVNELDRAEALWAAGLDGLITDEVETFEPQARLGVNPGRLLDVSALVADLDV